MPFPRKRDALQFSAEELRKLESISRSRTEERRRALRAAILLGSLSGQSDESIAERHHVSRGTVVLCIRKCREFGLDAALGELPRPGRPRQLTDDAVVWVQHCACQKPKELGYSYELWTYKLLTAHVRQHCVAAGHPALRRLSRSKLHKILRQAELRPHKIRYYVECRDLNFEAKMAIVLHIYKEVEVVNEYRQGEAGRQLEMVTISYDEKPGIQALGVTTLDRPPVVGTHASHLRDYEYKRLGTVSLLAGLDLHSGKVIETVSDTHKSADFISFLKKLEGAYPAPQKIRLVLDNHSAHISKETRNYLDTVPGRFLFVFTPTHGSWLNLIENQFSKMTRTMLRGIRVASKQELIDRIHQYFEEINAAPVVFRWKYKMDETVIV
ncbi:MAG TPA: IS630 family transposase [Candidatus Binatia bacterium]|nr:IS630 family transposase [Candidatus Binatia bacterium]